jgi:hypothetical protein
MLQWRIAVVLSSVFDARLLQLRKIDTDDECLANSIVQHLHGKYMYDIAAFLCVMSAKGVSQGRRQRICIDCSTYSRGVVDSWWTDPQAISATWIYSGPDDCLRSRVGFKKVIRPILTRMCTAHCQMHLPT